jgi:hypothetical protein
MSGCMILGDSLAIGIALALSTVAAPVCDVRARQGASTAKIARMADGVRTSQLVIVSAGSNDMSGAALLRELIKPRNQLP